MTTNKSLNGFSWFDLDDHASCDLYRQEWGESFAKRPHDHPDFIRMMSPKEYSPAVVVYRHADIAKVINPFYWRSLNNFPAFDRIAEPMIHVLSPYGYSGPLYEGPPGMCSEVSEGFFRLYTAELLKRGCVSEFIREDIFRERLAVRSTGQLLEQQQNVVVRLDRDPDAVWRGYKHKVRKNVNRANESSLRVVFDKKGEFIDGFIEVYYETMKRTAAAQSFFIPKEQFQSLNNTLGAAGGLIYAHVFDGDKIVSTELLLLSRDAIYSFLGGTLSDAFEKRPNDLLKHEVILWGGKNGYKWYVLGGGVTPGDGIFKYKETFDPGSVLPFYVRKVIHNPETYSKLVQKRIDFGKESGKEWAPSPNFFPEYLS
ncbi:MAG: hypothetical protein A2X26_13290 [Chloroflexi bacterium GWC2_49_37]|nr:MAG: hypothetical protein A2X26_13290 [Chloroflexi bacterium GWC2_49_37]